MIATEEEQAELYRAIDAYWDALKTGRAPTPAWKRETLRTLFGSPFLAPDDPPLDMPDLSAYEALVEAREVLALLDFHLDRLVVFPHGIIAYLLWERVKQVSERAIEILWTLRSKEEANDDFQAA